MSKLKDNFKQLVLNISQDVETTLGAGAWRLNKISPVELGYFIKFIPTSDQLTTINNIDGVLSVHWGTTETPSLPEFPYVLLVAIHADAVAEREFGLSRPGIVR